MALTLILKVLYILKALCVKISKDLYSPHAASPKKSKAFGSSQVFFLKMSQGDFPCHRDLGINLNLSLSVKLLCDKVDLN